MAISDSFLVTNTTSRHPLSLLFTDTKRRSVAQEFSTTSALLLRLLDGQYRLWSQDPEVSDDLHPGLPTIFLHASWSHTLLIHLAPPHPPLIPCSGTVSVDAHTWPRRRLPLNLIPPLNTFFISVTHLPCPFLNHPKSPPQPINSCNHQHPYHTPTLSLASLLPFRDRISSREREGSQSSQHSISLSFRTLIRG